MANTTVYPFGTEGTLPAGYPIINDVHTGGADKALSAEMGKYLNDEVVRIQGGSETKNINLSDYTEFLFRIDTATQKWEQYDGDFHQGKCVLIPLDYVKEIIVTATGGYATMAFLQTSYMVDGESPDFSAEKQATFVVADGNTRTFDVPTDAQFLYVYSVLASGTDIKGRYAITFDILQGTLVYKADLDDAIREVGETLIFPLFMYGSIKSDGGFAPTYRGTGAWVTPRYVAVNGNDFSITTGSARLINTFEYDADFSPLGWGASVTTVAETPSNLQIAHEGTKFVKILVRVNSNFEGDAKTTIKLEGTFPPVWEYFNLRSSDSGYQKVMVAVRVTDPTCCDEDTSAVQDASQILPDYGVICLPEQYSNTGKPTRLIIYCHGAAVNYADDASRFDSVDLDPTYWLAEGYAVMDVEGNPFDNTNEHICIPQAMDCYVAAYKWAIEHYNLCRDGVFLGGRSMGADNTFNLIRRECPIPVIAACPNSPSQELFGYNDATRKAFCALHEGFVLPNGFSWSDGNPTSAELQVLSDNWNKYVKCVPIYSLTRNLPDKQTILDNYTGDERVALESTWQMVAKCPVKIFGCNQDPSCPPNKTSALFYQMFMNAAQLAELRIFNSYKDYTGTGTTAHHYDTQDPALRTAITTSYGEELTDVPIVYIEMLAFWRRYEQGL